MATPFKYKIPKWIWLILIILLAILLLWQRGISSRNYPFYIASSWQCEDPSFSIQYFRDENGVLNSYQELEWNDLKIPVKLCLLMRDFDVYPADSSAYEDRLFSGTWRYRKGVLILFIEEDFLFGNQYAELVFTPIV